jgi:hypothetical protein
VSAQDGYKATLDVSAYSFNGQSSTDDFNHTLFGMGNLSPGPHTISLENTPSRAGLFVDLDWAVIEAGDGDVTSTNSDFWMDDQYPNITYDNNWSKGDNSLGHLGDYWNHTFSCAARSCAPRAAC